MTTLVDPGWVVLKFGGTSVSTQSSWRNIAAITRERVAQGYRVLIVHSAISGITDRLDKVLAAALVDQHAPELLAIQQRHRLLADELDVGLSVALEQDFATLQRLLQSVALVGEAGDRTRARVMAMGELMATEIGARYLSSVGIDCAWADARTLLQAEQRDSATARASYLSATCNFAPDSALRVKLAERATVVLTQGFIASDGQGDTVLLGRGGSDTSAAYLAAKLAADRLEIWTDVPGMFSANPRSTPNARQLRELTYEEAQEIATAGAKVLHPRCILPARQYRIPLHVLATQAPQLGGTVLSASPPSDAALVKAVCIKKGVTLVSMESPGMWHQVGFLADAFQIFKLHGLSVDLVSTSETNVTVSLDPQANSLDATVLATLVESLAPLCRAEVIGPCASVSLVGRNIRGILHQLGDALALFEEQKIYLVSQAANDLNLTFVVDERQGDRLVEDLHDMLVAPVQTDGVLGPTWEQLFGVGTAAPARVVPWWAPRRADLLALMKDRDCAYVYDGATIRERCASLLALKSVARVHYAMKANSNADVLRVVRGAGLAFECVSRGEVERVLQVAPDCPPAEILFTPNFAPRSEYAWALQMGLQVTVDNVEILESWPMLFAGSRIGLRIDPGVGRGHHHHVRTGGTTSKFGIPLIDVPRVEAALRRAGAEVVILHSHIGSGVFDVESWFGTGQALAELLQSFPAVTAINVGGGLGVPDHAGKPALDLARLDARLGELRAMLGNVELWLEPGRFVVAEAGVLLAKVTQLKSKGATRYVGVATGMNSLIRPALYGAHHDIFNLSRLDAASTEVVNVVGPICETGDFLGHDRLMPITAEGDVVVVATTGAYGAAMASRYNLREPAEEFLV